VSNTFTVVCMIACLYFESSTCICASRFYGKSKLQHSSRFNNKTFVYNVNGKFGPVSSSITAFPDFLVKLYISGCHSLHTCKE